MMEDLNYTQEQVAERMGKERSTVANYIRLLKSSSRYPGSSSKARSVWDMPVHLINVDTVDKQLLFLTKSRTRIFRCGKQKTWYENYINRHAAVKNSVKSDLTACYKKIEDNLASHFSTKVKLNHNKKGHGTITIEYYSLQELNKILDQMVSRLIKCYMMKNLLFFLLLVLISAFALLSNAILFHVKQIRPS